MRSWIVKVFFLVLLQWKVHRLKVHCAPQSSAAGGERSLKMFGVPAISDDSDSFDDSREFSRHIRGILQEPRDVADSSTRAPKFDRLFTLQFSGLADLLRRPSEDQCTPCTCGVSHREERIVGGTIAEVNAYPWLVALQYKQKFYCGGTLISNKFVLTAAHCVHGVPKDQITLVFGEHDRNRTDESQTQYRKIESFVKHPQFQRATFNNDVAVLRLDRPIRFNRYISPACLPVDFEDEDFDGEEGIVAGWGRVEEKGKPSSILREVRVPIMTNDECTKTKYTVREITSNMMCAGYEDGKLDACQGDSGGPLNWAPSTDSDTTYVIGIVSWGQGCARPQFPGIYTRLTKYLEWIRLNTLNSCFCSIP